MIRPILAIRIIARSPDFRQVRNPAADCHMLECLQLIAKFIIEREISVCKGIPLILCLEATITIKAANQMIRRSH